MTMAKKVSSIFVVLLLLLFLLLLVPLDVASAQMIKVLKSTVRLGDDRPEVAYSGAKLISDKRVNVRDVTIGIRCFLSLCTSM